MPQKLKIAVKPTFSAPVVMRLPGDEGGVVEVKFSAVFRRLNKSENLSLQARLTAQTITDAEVLDLVLVDWTGLVDEADMPFVFNDGNRAAAVEEWPRFEASIVLSYFEHLNPAIEKN